MSHSFIAELRRRNVFKVAIGYVLLGWVVLQVADVIVPALALPDWTITFLLVIGIFGFPFAIFFAWAYELTPDGIKPESEVNREHSITTNTGQKLNFIIMGLLAVGMGYFIYESRFLPTQNDEPSVVNNTSSDASTINQSASAVEGSSIAVLPFVNMSSDPEQEYFSDGISEEILNVLAKIPNLKVTSRSSTFAFKGEKINIAEVANKLGVSNVLEGSVRKSGNRVRITAQLIAADNDVHLWSETYDRELDDIFAIQDEISKAIVEALKDKLGIDSSIVNANKADVNLAAHNEYLKGRFFIEKRTGEDINRALEHFNSAIDLDPNYAPAWMGKAWAIHFLNEFNYGTMPISAAYSMSLPAIDRALELDPMLPEAHAIKGLIINRGGNVTGPELYAYFKKAIELNPNFSDAYTWYSGSVLDDAVLRLELREKAISLDPMSLLANVNYGYSLAEFGRIEEALDVANHIRTINPDSMFYYAVRAIAYSYSGELGKSVYYRLLRAKTNLASNNNVMYAFGLNQIGLPELAKDQLTERTEMYHLLAGNTEFFINSVKSVFPRGENDSLGNYLLGEAAMLEEDYLAVVRYWPESFASEYSQLAYAYRQTGDIESADELLAKLVAQTSQNSASGMLNLEYSLADYAYLNGDIDEAIKLIRQAVENGNLIHYYIRMYPMYEGLRNHPDWTALLAINETKQKEQADIYLQLVADNTYGLLE